MNPNHVRRLKRLIKKHVETANASMERPLRQDIEDDARIAELNLNTYISWLDEIYKDRTSGKAQG